MVPCSRCGRDVAESFSTEPSVGKCIIINGQSCREVGIARAADRARIADLERDLASALAQIVEVERVFGNASVFDAAHGNIVEKARIAYRGDVESQRLAVRLAEVERENAECCAADLKTMLERDRAVKARDAALARVAETERERDEALTRVDMSLRTEGIALAEHNGQTAERARCAALVDEAAKLATATIGSSFPQVVKLLLRVVADIRTGVTAPKGE